MALIRLTETALPGEPAAYFAPTYKMLAPVWREALERWAPAIAAVNAQERRIELRTGGSVDFWSLDAPNTARGRKYARAVIDEAAMIAALEEAWHSVIRPTLTDLHGDADFYSTPKGHNFFWRAFNLGQDRSEREWASWRFSTVDNPYIDPAEVEAARRQLPERVFQQEYEAVFLEDAGGVFRGVRAAVDAGRVRPTPPEQGARYAIGVDLARVEDFTVISVVDGDRRQVYFERFNQISWERQIAAIVAASQRYPGVVVVDATGVGDPIYERLRRARVPVKPYTLTNQSKEEAIDRLAMAIERGRIRLMDVPEQTAELQAYQYELTASRNVRMNAPEGMHDDAVIALALANWGAERYARVAPEPDLDDDDDARREAEEQARRQHLLTNPGAWR